MICSKCSHEFQLTPQHVGFANVCPVCTTGDVERVMATVAWSGKHVCEIEITTAAKAIPFNKAQRRFGASVMKSLCASRESSVGRESRKDGSGAEAGAGYVSNLGEKRTVKW